MGNELLCLRPRPSVDSRWLFYRLLSRPVVDWAIATSEGTKMPRTRWDRLGELRVPVPGLSHQRNIADFLDAETARPGALIDAKLAMRDLARERVDARVTSLLLGGQSNGGLPDGWRWMPARRLCPDVTVGVVVEPSSYFAPTGVPFIHGTDVRRGSID